jgi:hypothetical protein
VQLRERLIPYTLLGVLALGAGLGMGAGLSEAPAGGRQLLSSSTRVLPGARAVSKPATARPAWGLQSGCPAPGFTQAEPSNGQLSNEISQILADPRTAFVDTDPTFWPVLSQELPSSSHPGLSNAMITAPAAESPYADLIKNHCGSAAENMSWWVQVCPSSASSTCTSNPGLVSHWFFIDRSGQWVVWLIYP